MSRCLHRLILISSFALAGCAGGDDDGVNYTPAVRVECSSTAVSDCALNGKNVFVGVIKELVLACDVTLAGLSASQRQQLFSLSSEVLSTRSGIYLRSDHERWVNSLGGIQDTLDSGRYQMCAFVDANGNGQYDPTEPIGTGEFAAGEAFVILSNWISGS